MTMAGEVHRLNAAVVLTGTANEGKVGPPMGVVDVGVSDKAYLCRITLPGLRKNQSDLTFDVKQDGTVTIRGTVTVPEIPSNFQMIVQELNPPGKFTISFSLPGPVDTRLVYPDFRPDGICEIVVYKKLQENPAV